MTVNISIERISDPADGYVLWSDDGVHVNYCAVAADGLNLRCARGSYPRDKRPSVVDLFDHHEEDARADVPWAFAMAGGAAVDYLMDALGIAHVERDRTRPDLERIVSESSNIALRSIDRDALAVLSKSPSKRPGALAFYSAEGDRGVRRRQAAASYPLLADLLASGLSTKMAIDRSKPLAEPLGQALSGLVNRNVSKALLKRISQCDHVPDGLSLETVVRFMTLVPADWIPTSGAEWEAFCHAAHALLEDLDCGDDDVASLVKGCGGKWQEYCARVTRKAGMDPRDVLWGVRRAMFNASEMIDCFAEVAVLPMAAHASPSAEVSVTPEMMLAARRSAFAMLASGRSASDLSDLQRRFHQERETILGGTALIEQERLQKLKGEIEEGGWPALTDAVQAPNGLWLVPLTTPKELTAEGASGPDASGVEGLHHCVGGYSSKAKACDCHIVSVRTVHPNGSFSRVSTVEFGALQPGSDKLSVRQNMARENSAPSAASKDAVNWYVASVASGAIPLNRDQIKAFLDGAIIPDDGVERICGYDWRERDVLNAGVGPWGPFVVSSFRSMGLDAIMESPQVESVSKLISPDLLLSPLR